MAVPELEPPGVLLLTHVLSLGEIRSSGST